MTQLKKGRLILIDKTADVGLEREEQRRNLTRRAVAKADPDDLWRGATHDAEPMKVFVFRHERASLLQRELPDRVVGRSAAADQSNVE